MKNYILLTEKPWHRPLFESLSQRTEEKWHLIKSRENFDLSVCDVISPEKIFVPHWSYIIPKEIHEKYDCVIFHMTDLPYGRGGSPLQNLIVRGHKTTVMSALKADERIDAGDIYLKMPLNLSGTALEIFQRASDVIFKMIVIMVENQMTPYPQKGTVETFKRRKPADGNLSMIKDAEILYDYIRMLDAPTYPNAFIETDNFRLEFTGGKLNPDQSVEAHVKFIQK